MRSPIWFLRNVYLYRNWPDIYLTKRFQKTGIVELRDGTRMRIHSKDALPILWEIYGAKVYGPLTGREKVIVDVGANVGAYTLLALKHAPEATVYAYEPMSKNFKLLQENLEMQHYPVTSRTVLRQLAVAGSRGPRSLYIAAGGDSGHHSIMQGTVRAPERTETVQCVTIDDIIDEVGDIDILKLDVEMAEDEIMLSCTQPHRVKRIEIEPAHRKLADEIFGASSH